MDLASGHVAALKHLFRKHQRIRVPKKKKTFYNIYFLYCLQVFNLGTGKGVSVLELVKTFEKTTGTIVSYKIVDRREGDISVMYANTDLAEKELGWKAKHTLDEMCKCKVIFRKVEINSC